MSIKITLLLILAIAVAVVLSAVIGLQRAKTENASIVRDKIYAGSPGQTIDLSPAVYAELPQPVKRYFDFAFNGNASITLSGIEWS